jgi:hypothetical protein
MISFQGILIFSVLNVSVTFEAASPIISMLLNPEGSSLRLTLERVLK